MKIKTIKLITDWTIYIWEMEDDLTDINTTGLCGQCFNRKNTIHIYPGMSKAETKKTLLHELIHAMIWESGHQFEENEDEAICRALEGQLYLLLKNNFEELFDLIY